MSAHAERYWRERVAVRYLDALDAGDLDAVVSLWDQAAADADLHALLVELNEGLHQEEGTGADLATDAARVLELAHRHMPGAFPPGAPPDTLTASAVARRLEADPEFRRVSPPDRVVHARLLADASPVPDAPTRPQIERWMTGLGLSATPAYLRAFHKAALLLGMARNQEEGRLAAARRAAPPADPKGGT